MKYSERVREANDENEIWKVIKDVANPKSDSTIRLVEDGEIIEDEKRWQISLTLFLFLRSVTQRTTSIPLR